MIPKYIITSPNKQFTEMVYNTTKELDFTDYILIENALEEAVNIVAKYIKKFPISIIVSRGATAKMIKKITDLPVLEADSTPFDILTAIMEAMKTSKNIAFIHYDKNITENFSNIVDLFNINLKEYYYTNHYEIEQCVYDAYKDKNEVVVCGYSYIENICKKLGIESVMYSTSNYAMKEILSKASLIKYAQERQLRYEKELLTFIDEMPDGVIYLNEKNVITLINNTGKKLLLLKDNQNIAGQPISNFISKHNLLEIINKKKNELGKEIEFSGNKILIRSTPLFDKETYMGTVLIFQKSYLISKMDQNVRRQNINKGLNAYITFRDLEATTVSIEMKNCIEKAKQYANTESTILITGESGTGKEMFAQSIHNASSRKNEPFVAINCASLPQNLLESELFGYEEGSFTGAKAGGKPGLFELAHNGTLFLDELGLLPLSAQVQLLRVLQERQVMRVGGTRMIPISIRIIAATNSNLKKAVENGTFRHDLYYRINVLNISIPPLNKRKDDIPLLLEHYLSLFRARYNKNIKSCSPDFIQAFQDHDWSGNIRELVNYIMRIVILSDSEILTAEDIIKSEVNLDSNKSSNLKEEYSNSNIQIVLTPDTLESLEKNIIKWYMNKYDGNRSKICKSLNISRTTLWKKLSALKEENKNVIQEKTPR